MCRWNGETLALAELGARDIHVRSARRKRDQQPRGYASPISAPRRHEISPLPITEVIAHA
jgi:hypothetical protein